MNDTPRGERLHIGIFGRRNTGKSSLINAVTNQEIALVSDVPGTTTDPVYKSMEILPIGPVVIIDTAGLDDTGELGEKRVGRSLEVLAKCDIALVTAECASAAAIPLMLEYELGILDRIKERGIPALLVLTKCDRSELDVPALNRVSQACGVPVIQTSSATKKNIESLKRLIIENAGASFAEKTIVGDIVHPGDTAVLVVPIDNAAPKGRLILPQVQTIRDILDNDATALVVKERELSHALRSLSSPPRIVITDSQAFQKVAADTPPGVLLTSFSILFARHKGDLETYIRGVRRVKDLKDGDRVLIAEACTHHVQSDDIGTVKIPRWLRNISGRELVFDKVSGSQFPDNLKDYALVVHCGGCMLNRREVMNRLTFAEAAGVPITNYGMLIAYTFGILERALAPFPMAAAALRGDIY